MQRWKSIGVGPAWSGPLWAGSRWTQRALFLLLLIGGGVRAEELGVAKVFRGDEGLEITVVRYGPRERHQALVQVSGVDSPWNGQVFLTDHEESERVSDYRLESARPERWIIRGRKSAWGNHWNYQAYPGDHREYELRYDEERSRAVKVSELAEAYSRHPGQPTVTP